jgi:UDP-N-acetyl-D-glucosamine dehydrogenase
MRVLGDADVTMNTERLRRRILNRESTVAIVGQGYVGLSLACEAAVEGFAVVAIDVDVTRVGELNSGELTVPGVPSELFARGIASGRIRFTDSAESVPGADVILICVPTPLKDGSPDLTHIDDACRDVARVLTPGKLVVLESTTYPGTTDQRAREHLQGNGLLMGRDFLLAYSPERIDPGNEEFGLRNTPKVVGGCTPEATNVATLFYGQLIDKVVVMSSAKAAELAKLLENTFRHVNIALVNELAMLCHEMRIDVWEVVDAAATKPFGFMPFYPGPGVGGHCIPLDPTYLAWQIRRDVGRQFRLLEQAQDLNGQAPRYVTDRIAEALNERGHAVRGAKIVVLGVAYKPDIGDLRESASLKVIEGLQRRGANVTYHDPHVAALKVGGTVMRRTELSRRALSRADCVALLTPHSTYDVAWIADCAQLVFDAQNAYGPDRRANVVRL